MKTILDISILQIFLKGGVKRYHERILDIGQDCWNNFPIYWDCFDGIWGGQSIPRYVCSMRTGLIVTLRAAGNHSTALFSSLTVIGEQNPTHLYEQAHDRVGNCWGQEGENHLCATICSFLLGRVCLKKSRIHFGLLYAVVNWFLCGIRTRNQTFRRKVALSNWANRSLQK